ncbi:MAG: radical SAM protein [Alphaproteobacteria bacterium]|nr:radical SAM protein [Alphaproteobacteria bacterium]
MAAAQSISRDTQDARNETYQALAQTHGLLPIKVTPFYQKKVDEEVTALGHFGGPLARTVYPSDERLQLRAPGEVADWVDDRSNMIAQAKDIFIQKYENRILFTPTSTCAAHCLYCFRQDVLTEQKAGTQKTLDEQLKVLTAHLKAHAEVTEVILSGGDPLTLSYADLERIFVALAEIKSVSDIRIHTRVPIFAPSALKNDEKLALFAKYNVRMVLHSVHPYEICEDVIALLARMHAHGIRVYNHFPILRHVNDHADVLLELMQKLETHHVRTLSIYVPEPIYYSAAYRISYDRMCRIIDAVNQRAPSWLNSFRFCLDSPHGKVRRENLVMRDNDANILVFMREGQRIVYPDLPEKLDAPGDIKTLLWKTA